MRNACYYPRWVMANEETSEQRTTTTEKLDVSYGGGVRCSVCFELIIEPVVFPCRHEVCESCFHKNLRAANFCCPICRLRISSWARKRVDDPVDKKRRKELASAMTETSVVDQSLPVFRRIASPGEIHKDYMDEKKVVDKEREEEYKLGREEAVRLAQADHQAMMEQIAKDEEVATELAKTIEQQDLARQEQEELDRSFAEQLDQINTKQTTPTRITKVKPSSSSSSKKKKPSTTNKSKDMKGILPISIWLKPKVTSKENESASSSSSSSSITPADKQIEMDYKIALELQQKWQQN
ncbi:E3 ubiquitin-protein ligase RNF168-like [Dysidea avara]|uniref:E3 ubiquitin-protein ligase RNF168-like n=1 Tax=Dysidea avara TaxID=196820 RepID=UPI003317F0CF